MRSMIIAVNKKTSKTLKRDDRRKPGRPINKKLKTLSRTDRGKLKELCLIK